MLGGDLQHVKVDVRIFVPGESDEASFACFSGFEQRFLGPALVKNAIWVVKANDFMMLDQIHVIDLQASQGLVQLSGSFFFGSSIDFRHQEDFFAVALL
jgi:hypothetical protein